MPLDVSSNADAFTLPPVPANGEGAVGAVAKEARALVSDPKIHGSCSSELTSGPATELGQEAWPSTGHTPERHTPTIQCWGVRHRPVAEHGDAAVQRVAGFIGLLLDTGSDRLRAHARQESSADTHPQSR